MRILRPFLQEFSRNNLKAWAYLIAILKDGKTS